LIKLRHKNVPTLGHPVYGVYTVSWNTWTWIC